MNLFDEADAHAAALRRVPRYCDADLEIMFRKLQKQQMPELPDAEFQALYRVWRDRHDGRVSLERKAQLERIPQLLVKRDRLADARERINSPLARELLTDLLLECTTEIASLLEPIGGREPQPGDATWPAADE